VAVVDAVEAVAANALAAPCHRQAVGAGRFGDGVVEGCVKYSCLGNVRAELEQEFNGVQGGLVVEGGQGNEGLQGRQLVLADPLAPLEPFAAVDDAVANGSDGEACRQGGQHWGQPIGQGVPAAMVKA